MSIDIHWIISQYNMVALSSMYSLIYNAIRLPCVLCRTNYGLGLVFIFCKIILLHPNTLFFFSTWLSLFCQPVKSSINLFCLNFFFLPQNF